MQKWAYKWQVLFAVVFGTFMVIMDATIVNVALPTLQRDFGGNLSDVQWIVSAYTLALGIVTPISGFLADRFGIKRVYMVSLGLFTLGSALCAIAPGLPFLVLFRVIQGLGGSSVIPLSTALLFKVFEPKERGQAYGIYGIALVMAPALGPLISGAFVEYLNWRFIFLVNLPIGLAGLYFAGRLLREEKSEKKPRLDGWGLAASTVAFGLILYGFSISENEGWGSAQVILSLAVGAVALLAFCVIELRRREGLVDLRLFRLPTFLVGSLVGWVSVIALFGAEFLLPLYLQILRGQTALQTGFLLLPLALASGFSVPIAGRFSDKFGPRWLVAGGFALLMVNTWQLSSLTLDTAFWYIALLLVLRGISFGMIIQVTQQASLLDVKPWQLNRASALISSSRLVFQSLGVSILATIVSSTAGKAPAFTSGTRPDPAALAAFQQNYLHGLENAYVATFWLALVSLVLALFLPGRPVTEAKGTTEAPVEVQATTDTSKVA
ncbi:MAG TPA: MDR family MFS transporter [Chloroflexia bacterium]|nr:MDR family MFS transporter [Chloroflexia bacterium]